MFHFLVILEDSSVTISHYFFQKGRFFEVFLKDLSNFVHPFTYCLQTEQGVGMSPHVSVTASPPRSTKHDTGTA
jgi:hypothetical protein